MNNTQKALIALIRNAVCGTDESVDIESIDKAQQIWELAAAHSVSNIAASQLIKHKLFADNSDMQTIFSQEMYYAMRDSEHRDYELTRVCQALDNAEIPYIPLKGAVIKEYYPESWYRTSSDVDILVHENQLDDAVKALLTIPGYHSGEREKHDISLYSENGFHVELHFLLVEYFPKADKTLSKVWECSSKCENYMYHMSNEFYYLYHIIHMAKHFIHGGCGIKPFIDMWLIENKFDFDYKKFIGMLDKCGMKTFYEKVRYVMTVWLENAPGTELSNKIAEYVFEGGVYGTIERMTAVERARTGRFGFMMSRLFLPMEQLKISYKILNKYPFLAPYYHIKRIVKVITDGRVGRSVNELKISNDISDEELEFVSGLVRELEL